VSDAKKYLGLDIHAALAAAQAVGEQLRVMAVNHITHRHSGEDQAHVQVWVKNGIVTKAQMEEPNGRETQD
jgi:hypothetical protein